MLGKNETTRLEAFCDAVFAIAITLLILEIKVPPLASIHSAKELQHKLFEAWPAWFGYLQSFMMIFVSWVNHHSAFKLINRSSSQFIYANGFLLLTVAILSYTTGLMMEYLNTDFAQPAITCYCLSILIHNFSWVVFGYTLTHPYVIARDEKSKVILKNTVARNSRFAFFIYLGICILSVWLPLVAMILITASWIFWVITSFTIVQKRTPSE